MKLELKDFQEVAVEQLLKKLAPANPGIRAKVLAVDSCHIPDDHVDTKRRGYLWGKEVLEELIEGLKRQEEEARR